jgi:hypothetical protein
MYLRLDLMTRIDLLHCWRMGFLTTKLLCYDARHIFINITYIT